jgi:probable HAF family extracellular repeat protein
MTSIFSIERNRIGRLAPAFVVMLLVASPVAAQTYTVTDLGTLGTNSRGSYSQAFCINASGQVAGQSSASSSVMTDPAFLYSDGKLTSIGTLGGEYGQGRGINTSGQIAGYSTLPSGSYRAFLYTGGQMTDLGTLGADYSVAYALNDAGQVVGTSALIPEDQHAFLYGNGQMTDLGTLGGATSTAYGINTHGVIVGYSYNSGTVVGLSTIQNSSYHAFISTNGGKMQDLNNMISAGTGWVLQEAAAINDAGQIAGYGTINGQSHAFLLTPVQ